jgi:hypothetical protein
MRKTTVILLTVLATLPAVAIADPSPGANAKNKAPQGVGVPIAHTCEKNPVAFCYFEDMVYSEGAVVGGKVCERSDTMDTFSRKSAPLFWNNPNVKR